MTRKGWIKLHRSLLNWEWYDDTNVKILFLHLLLNACYKDTKYKGFEIKRGSVAITIGGFGEEIGLTRQQTRTALDKLIATNEITTKTTNKFTTVNVTNFNKWQSEDVEDNKQNNKQDNQQVTNNIENNNHQVTSIEEEGKKVLEKEGKKEPPYPLGEDSEIPNEGKEKPKQSNKEKLISLVDERSFSDSMKKTILLWLEYKDERNDKYKPTGWGMLLTQIENNIEKYSEQAVIQVIEQCMASNYAGIIFNMIKKDNTTGGADTYDPVAEFADRMPTG